MTYDLPGLCRVSLLLFTGAGLLTLLLTPKFPLWARLGIAVLPPLGLIVLGNWWISLVIRPCIGDWSGPRLAPAVALLHGYKLYQPPDCGPVNGWIYPPVSALCYLPAAWLGDPT